MATKNLDTDRGTAAFSHFSPKYKCCCGKIHVKQGTLLACVVSAIIDVVVLLHAVISFSEEHLLSSTFYLVRELAEIICVVLLLVAVLKDRKRFLLPYLLMQVFSVLVYVIFALLCIWTAVDTDNYAGTFFKKEFMSRKVFEIEKSHPEMAGKKLVLLMVIYVAIVLIMLCPTLWFLFVVYRFGLRRYQKLMLLEGEIVIEIDKPRQRFSSWCYQYYTDMEKHREPFDTPVSYNAQQALVH